MKREPTAEERERSAVPSPLVTESKQPAALFISLLSKTGFFLDSSLRPEPLRVEIESYINALKVPFHRRCRAVCFARQSLLPSWISSSKTQRGVILQIPIPRFSDRMKSASLVRNPFFWTAVYLFLLPSAV
jgi:hypothetical protein